MEVWHTRLPTWTPEQAYDALLKVHPFGPPSDRDVGLCVYNWLRGTWRSVHRDPLDVVMRQTSVVPARRRTGIAAA